MPKWSRLAKIFITGAVALGVAVAWFSGNLFYSLFWALLEEFHVPVKEADVIAYTLAHLIPFAAVLLISAVFYFVVRREMASASSSAGKALPDVSAAVHRADREQRLTSIMDWKMPIDAIEAFGSKFMRDERDRKTQEVDEISRQALEDEEAIRQINKSYPAKVLAPPDVVANYDQLHAKLVDAAFDRDDAENGRKHASQSLLAQIVHELAQGKLIAKGFRMPRDGLGETEIPQSEWRGLELDPITATASHCGTEIFTDVLIGKPDYR